MDMYTCVNVYVCECSCLKCVCVVCASASACIRVNHWHYAANCFYQKSVRQDSESYYTIECGPECVSLVQHAHLGHSYKYTQYTRNNTKYCSSARVCVRLGLWEGVGWGTCLCVFVCVEVFVGGEAACVCVCVCMCRSPKVERTSMRGGVCR